MSEINDGGPAFPCLEATVTGIDSDGNERLDTEAHGGMSLRDYFAAKAMTRIVAYDKEGCMSPDITAMASYSLADAMLKARES